MLNVKNKDCRIENFCKRTLPILNCSLMPSSLFFPAPFRYFSHSGSLLRQRGNPLIESLLVANRGEIACRIFKTAKRLGIRTIAVYSEADSHSPHVDAADEAVCIGPPPSSESYLRIDRILEAVQRTKAAAIHPGYGFLSERAAFVKELEANNVIFVGPDYHAISAMGDKIESKKIASQVCVVLLFSSLPPFPAPLSPSPPLFSLLPATHRPK